MLFDIGFLVAGLILLFLGGHFLLKSAVSISLIFNIPKIIIGMTVVSFATSAPELIVSVNAALNGESAVALGNVMGSNIANIGLVLALVIIFSSMEIKSGFYRVDWPVLMFMSVLFAVFLFMNEGIQRWEAAVLLMLLILFFFYLIKFQTDAVEEVEIEEQQYTIWLTLFYLVLGGLALWAGSEFLVNGAVSIAKEMGVSTRVIAVSIVAIGTSVPELASSIFAALKKEKAISLGNLIGSNIFNIGGVIGITGLITPIDIKPEDGGFLDFDIYVVLLFAFILLPLVFAPIRHKLTRWEGIVLLFLYGGFMYFSFR